MSESDMSKMTRKWQRTYEFQMPSLRPDKNFPPVYLVCPHCKMQMTPTGCNTHGDVKPIRSAVVNGN